MFTAAQARSLTNNPAQMSENDWFKIEEEIKDRCKRGCGYASFGRPWLGQFKEIQNKLSPLGYEVEYLSDHRDGSDDCIKISW